MKLSFAPPAAPHSHMERTTIMQKKETRVMSPEDANFSNIFKVMHAKINTLFDYLHGRRTGIDVVDYARKIKNDSDAILNHMSCHHKVDKDLSLASTALMSLKNLDNVSTERTIKHTCRQARLHLKARKPKAKKGKKISNTGRPNRRMQKKQRQFAKRVLSDGDVEIMIEAVRELGGADMVCKKKRWKQIAKRIRTEEELRTQTSAGHDIKKIYFSIAK